MAKKDEFNLRKDLPVEALDTSINKDDFKLIATDAKITDKKFNTKPTTFFKDCLKRFAKNKSSVVAACILGTLLLMSIIVPLFGTEGSVHDVSSPNTAIKYLEPRLFSSGSFWSGKRKLENVPIDVETKLPDQKLYDESAISNFKITGESYTEYPSDFGKDGYVEFSAYSNNQEEKEYYISPLGTVEKYDFNNSLLIN